MRVTYRSLDRGKEPLNRADERLGPCLPLAAVQVTQHLFVKSPFALEMRVALRPRPSVQHVLDAFTGAAAFVHNARLDNLAANQLGYALYSDMFSRAAGPGPADSARYVFLDPSARDFYADWDRAASDVVAVLRSAAGRDPHDRDLSDLVGELSTQSAEFRTRWAAHNVRFHDPGSKELHHPVVGDITLTYNRLELAADPGQMLMIWTAEPGSKSAEALSLLGSWAATPDEEIASADHKEPPRHSGRAE